MLYLKQILNQKHKKQTNQETEDQKIKKKNRKTSKMVLVYDL